MVRPAEGGNNAGQQQPRQGQQPRQQGNATWGNPDASGFAAQNIVTVRAGGMAFQVNRLGAVQFQGFINALIARGYKPKSVGGYNNRNIAGTSRKSNHAYGASIDIDPGENPQYTNGRGGKFSLPPDVGQLAAQFGLVWGGDYSSSKDYMHFELAGAPSTPRNLTARVDATVQQAGGLTQSMQRAGQGGGAVPGGAAGGVAGGGDPSVTGAMGADPSQNLFGPDGKIDWNKAIAEYGYIAELARSNPELGKLIEDAARGGWSDDEVAARFKETNYWRSTSDAQRANELLKKTNPGEYRRRRQQMIDKINILSRRLGAKEGTQRVFILAERFLSLGTTDQEIERLIAADVRIAPSTPTLGPNGVVPAGQNTGQTAVTVDAMRERARAQRVNMSDATLQQWVSSVLRGDLDMNAFDSFLLAEAKKNNPDIPVSAFERGETVDSFLNKRDALKAQLISASKNYLVPLSEQTVMKWATQITAGDMTPESFDSYLKEQAKSLFPTLGGAIDRGVTVAQYIEPYRQIAAQTLEINPDEVDFSNPVYGKALVQVDAKTGERTSMGLSEFQEYLRGTPGWRKTRQANEQAASLTERILRDFGAVA